MQKSIKVAGVAVLAVIVIAVAVFFLLRGDKPSENLLSHAQAEEIVKNILTAEEEGEDMVAYLWPEMLNKGDEVLSWDNDQEEEDEIEVRKMKGNSWLAWIDHEPGNVFFAHQTEFVYIDAVSGEYERVADDFWPMINEESFEGDDKSTITIDSFEDDSQAYNFGNLRERMASYMKEVVGKEAKAQGGGYIRIDLDETDAPQGEYYALVVSGFGRNSWVFLEGTRAMYDALKSVGYDDDHITYLAQGRAQVDPNWNRQGTPQLIEAEGVDNATSPDNVEAAINAITEQMTDQDSFFVFILAHGNRNRIALGKPVSGSQQSDINSAMRGRRANFRSRKLSDTLLGGGVEACEIMVVFDSCYSGTHEQPLRAKYDPERIKRLQVAHSTDDRSRSYGADYRLPVNLNRTVRASLDVAARRTPVADPNPDDFAGEFSSGFISNVGLGIFSIIYESGVALDAADLNDMTEPYTWQLGSDGPCVEPVTDSGISIEDDQSLVAPDDQPEIGSTGTGAVDSGQTAPKEMIKVIEYNNSYIPYSQLKVWTAAECDGCAEDHYHAVSGSVTTVDGDVISDPFVDCGLGKVSQLPMVEIEVE